MSIWTALGEEGTVYINVPPEGEGRVRVLVSGAISHVKARSKSDKTLEEGTKVRVCRIIDDNTVEVEPMENREGERDA
jgi:membrane protein implicated in regulation of membrane protease activity